jgi:D-serine deaminase-like pyridoxal phosphate-dependent protein
MQSALLLSELSTPCLLLDQQKLDHNIKRMRDHLARLGVRFRPHLKTCKSIDVARRVLTGHDGPAMVSTLKEAEYFAGHGVTSLIYGVGITPQKLDRVGAIRERFSADVSIVLDSVEQADAVAAWGLSHGTRLLVYLEVDSDGHRAGVAPQDSTRLRAIADRLNGSGSRLRGVISHAGGSYSLTGADALRTAAVNERIACVTAAAILREAGHACPEVSIGSTPTALFATDLTGVTEARAGVYMFGDLVQAGIGTCSIAEIAISVLTTVIGHQENKGWTLVDAGWMALSRDRGREKQSADQGYGMVLEETGTPYPDLIVLAVNQEHGIVGMRSGSSAQAPILPIGTRLRILPNHACATAAQHDRYHVLNTDHQIIAQWPRIQGW